MLQQSLQNALARGTGAARGRHGGDADAGGPVRSGAEPADQADRPRADRRTRSARLREAGRAVGRTAPATWRRMATSPLPLGVVEFPVVQRLLDAGVDRDRRGRRWPAGVPGSAPRPRGRGRGGRQGSGRRRFSRTQLEAEVLMILTNVDAVFEGWGTPAARPIRRMTVAQAEALIARGGARRGRHEAQGRGRRRASRATRAAGRIIARLSDGPGGPPRRDRHDHHEGHRESARIPGARAAQGRGHPDVRRRRGLHAHRGRGDRPAARRHRRDQGAGARRRPGQGRRREAGPQPGRGRGRGGRRSWA